MSNPILPHVSLIPPYPPGRPIEDVAREFGLEPSAIVKLASNENPLGTAPAATEAIRQCNEKTYRYPDFHNFSLIAALAAYCGLPEDHILPGCGSSELILMIAHGFLNHERQSVYPRYSFASYAGASKAAGSEGIACDVHADWRPDLDALLQAGREERTKVVFLATPNNPTGALTPAADVHALAEALPDDTLLVIDEAYREYLDEADRPDISRLLSSRKHIVILRTFSKIFGLAGARVGYAITHPELLKVLQPMGMPFGVNMVGQQAAAAALGDDEFINRSRQHNAVERVRLCDWLTKAGFEYVPSHGNFVLMKSGDGATVSRELMKRGVIIRPVGNYGLPDWIRVSVGTAEENDTFIEALSQVSNIRTHAN
ncbi:histidinol-phosphate transaminase [uncultured Hyphomonas sp.]|uniref:histidinol-phosphate transaminase n=1 Tax=uncultured Hyphomonas sp. TaxID=225298 RepID=UPI002AAC0E73|nr:histidinol-phosphate transaminase [uncultured Hyphomonas sp.]